MNAKWSTVVAIAAIFAFGDLALAQQPSDWESMARTRRAEVERVLRDNRASFDAFDTGSLGDATLEMIPFVVFRALQELEPEVFGDSALASFGFFERTDTPTRLNGITWTRPASTDGGFEVRY